MGIISCLCFYVTGRLAEIPKNSREDGDRKLLEEEDNVKANPDSVFSLARVFTLTKEMLAADDFLRIVATNFLHICRRVY